MSVEDDRGVWAIRAHEAAPSPTAEPRCPTTCDHDCDAGCHEAHQPAVKREHDPANCPSVSPAADGCTTLGCPALGTVTGIYDDGDEPSRVTYCRECADALRGEFTPDAPSPAADGCGHPNHGAEDHDCAQFCPAAEPPEGLREALAEAMYEYLSPLAGPLAAADTLLAGPLAPLLARLRDAETAVERCEALLRDAERFPEGHILNRVAADSLRYALSGNAR